MPASTPLHSDPIAYWDERHRTSDEWRSGGDRGIDIYRNRAFYAHRLGLLVSILDRYHIEPRLRILDAGCGKGWLSTQLAAQGHEVVGIDASAVAVEIARKRQPSVRFVITTLEAFRDWRRFDAVVCMDVLFHILDDELWQRSLANLTEHVAQNGLLVISDTPCNQPLVMGNYIVHRPLDAYLRCINRYGLTLVDRIPYEFAGNPNQFYVFKR